MEPSYNAENTIAIVDEYNANHVLKITVYYYERSQFIVGKMVINVA